MDALLGESIGQQLLIHPETGLEEKREEDFLFVFAFPLC